MPRTDELLALVFTEYYILSAKNIQHTTDSVTQKPLDTGKKFSKIQSGKGSATAERVPTIRRGKKAN